MTFQKQSFPALPINALSDITRNWEYLLKLINVEWIEPTLEHAWVWKGGNLTKPQYLKDLQGWVHIRGAVKEGELARSIFTLPSGFRPGGNEVIDVIGGGPVLGYVEIETDGKIIPHVVGEAAKEIFFGNTAFRAEKEN